MPQFIGKRQHVAIIGGGAAGMVSARQCVHRLVRGQKLIEYDTRPALPLWQSTPNSSALH